jgi:hypothetical protein
MVFTATGAGVAAVGNVMALLIGAWHHPFARDFFSARPEASRECGERNGRKAELAVRPQAAQ